MEALEKTQNPDLLYIGYNLAALALARRTKLSIDWLTRRYLEMREQLEDSPIYQMTVNIGVEKGLKQGFEQGLKRGLRQGIKQGLGQEGPRTRS